MIVIVMGVSGCGKTTVGKLLAHKLGLPFFDADDFHPAVNIDKMRSGHALTDSDREPWLKTLSVKLDKELHNGGAVLACSALKQRYRDILIAGREQSTRFVYLKAERDRIIHRMSSRQNHYMPLSLLDSQFETLEEPAHAITISASESPETIVSQVFPILMENSSGAAINQN